MSNAGKVEAKEKQILRAISEYTIWDYEAIERLYKKVQSIDDVLFYCEVCARRGVNLDVIPLTEEWLVKFGFEYEDLGDDSPYEWYKKDGVTVWEFNGKDKHWIYDAADQDGIDQSHFKYVHQLMNLFHSLTGAELEVK